MRKLAVLMECFWLTLAILSAGWAGWHIATLGWAAAGHLSWFPLVCGAMFLYRRFMRHRMARWAERNSTPTDGGPAA